MNAVILIPARYQSSRYPGKPLVQLKGATGTPKPLIQRSVEAARRVRGVSGVFVVTDDERIADACIPAKVGVIMTSSELPELLTVCDRILVLSEGRLTASLRRGEATEQKIMEAATLGAKKAS